MDPDLAPVPPVSIHAPARGATGDAAGFGRHRSFRSTPLREGRPESVDALRVVDQDRFDPRPCARGDRSQGARGGRCHSFDPRPCARGDRSQGARGGRCHSFDPRPCARGDRHSAISTSRPRRFDPRPCARGDVRCGGMSRFAIVSIHAPARGATRYQRSPPYSRVFRSTPLREGRHQHPRRGGAVGVVSIHAPARGATPINQRITPARVFRSTPLREGRPA